MTATLRRRIKWRKSQCTAEFTADVRCVFAWTHRHHEYDDCSMEMVELEYQEWELFADCAQEGKFASKEEMVQYIIRSTYDIPPFLLIPSEVLYDAGLIYVTNEWVDTWGALGAIDVEFRIPMPAKPQVRGIRLPDAGEVPDLRKPKKLMVEDSHRTRPRSSTVLNRIWNRSKPEPHEPKRLGAKDDLDLSWEEEYDVWVADEMGSGTDEYDFLDDDECYYVLNTGECNAQTCAIVTIDEETPEGEEGRSQVQNAGEADVPGSTEAHSRVISLEKD